MKTFITAFWFYTKSPARQAGPELTSARSKIRDCFVAIGVYYMSALVFSVLLAALAKLITHVYSINLLAVRDENIGTAVKGAYTLLIVALLGPILEEAIFRLWLSFKRMHIFLSLMAISFVVLTKLDHSMLYSTKTDKAFLVRMASVLPISCCLYLLFNLPFFRKKIDSYFKFLYWGSCVAFGLMHMSNFTPLKSTLLWAYPLLVLPQLTLGFILGYLRIKNGFFWALLVHCLVNLPGAFFYYFK